MNFKSFKVLPSLALLGGLLTACGGDEVGNEDRSEPNLPPIIPEEPTQINIQETTLPLIEDFSAVDTGTFFSPDYKSLETSASNDIEDGNGNTFTFTDAWPSLYYPTNGFFDTDLETGELIAALPEEGIDRFQFRVQDGKLGIANTRFSIAQILTDLAPLTNIEPKRNTTGEVSQGTSIELGSWGELDLLSAPYRVSFCLVDFGQHGEGASNIELWVDNNSGGNSNRSIHVNASLLLRTAITSGVSIAPGYRLVIDVPGDVYLVDNDGNRVERDADGESGTEDDFVGGTLGIIPPQDGISMPVGTLTSFFQFRVSSGGYTVLDDFIIERQTDNNAQGLVCQADPDYWNDEEIPIADLPYIEQRELLDIPGASQFAGLPLNIDASAGEVEFFAQANGAGDPGTTTGAYLAVSDNPYDSFYKETGSSSRVFVEAADNAVRFGQARWAIGLKDGDPDDCINFGGYDGDGAGCPGGTPNGEMDLSSPYRIRAQLLELPLGNGELQIYIDNNTSNSGNSVHGNSSRIANLENTFGGLSSTGDLVINVPGDILLNGSTIGSVGSHVGTTTSFIGLRCPSNCGEALDDGEGNLSGGIVLGDIIIEAQ